MARQAEREDRAGRRAASLRRCLRNPTLHRLTDAELAQAAEAPDPTSGNPNILPLGFSRGPVIPAPRGAGAALAVRAADAVQVAVAALPAAAERAVDAGSLPN